MKMTVLAALVMLTPWLQQASREETALLEGVVVEQGTGAPIARARALLALNGDPDPKNALSATTDPAGKFTFESVPPGIYQLFVGHAAYVPAEYGQRSPSKPGLPIKIAVGQAIHVDLKLTPAASIHGKVTDQQGTPIPEFVVKAIRATYERGERVFRGGEYAVTEASGEFRLFGLAPGWYFLSAAAPEEHGPLPLNGGGIFSWPTYYGGATEDEAQPIQLAPGGNFDAGVLVTLRGPAVRVRGQILDAQTGKADPNARVLLGQKRRRGIETSGLAQPALRTGYFELAGAAPGDYVIDAVTPSLAGSVSFQARGAAIDDLTVMLYPRLSIPGHARIDSELIGQSAFFATMRLVLDAGHAAVEAPIDPRGMFTLTDVPVGDYRVTLAGAPSNVYLKAARFGAEDVLETGLRIQPKATGALEITLGSTSAVLNVIALDAKRAPVPDAVVVLAPKSRDRLELYRTALADTSGNARFDAVPPGEYRVFAWEEIEENAWQDPDILRAYESHGESVTLKETGISIITVSVDRLWP